MLKGFRDFLLRGNVVDLAVAVVIGTAFTAIVTAFSNYIINPLLATIGGADVSGFGVQLMKDKEATFIDFGAVITAAINFVLIAAIVYFVLIVPVNAAKARLAPKDEEDEPLSETDLLVQIRDLLEEGRYQTASGTAQAGTGQAGTAQDFGNAPKHQA